MARKYGRRYVPVALISLRRLTFSTAALRTPGVTIGGSQLAVLGSTQFFPDTSGLVIDAVGTIGFVTGIATPGTGYLVNDQLYDGLGGILLVSAVSAGGITGAAYIAGREPYNFGSPPASVTPVGGSGSGAVINVGWAPRTGLILNKSGAATLMGGTLTVSGGTTVNAALSANAGLYLGSTAAGSITDFSHHINLYGSQYGICVTGGQLNYGGPATMAHAFNSGGTITGTIGSNGTLKMLSGMALFNGTPVTTKPTLSGAWAGNTAGKALATLLASYGLLTDSSTA